MKKTKIFERRSILQPKFIYWIYTSIVRIIVTYGAMIWLTAVEKKTNVVRLTKVQKLAGQGTTPQAALEVILNLLPLQLD